MSDLTSVLAPEERSGDGDWCFECGEPNGLHMEGRCSQWRGDDWPCPGCGDYHTPCQCEVRYYEEKRRAEALSLQGEVTK